MSIELNLPPELESQLREISNRTGQPLSDVILSAAREGLQSFAANGNEPSTPDLSPAEWSARFQAWADSFPPISHFVDDSRESIYEDRDGCQLSWRHE